MKAAFYPVRWVWTHAGNRFVIELMNGQYFLTVSRNGRTLMEKSYPKFHLAHNAAEDLAGGKQ